MANRSMDAKFKRATKQRVHAGQIEGGKIVYLEGRTKAELREIAEFAADRTHSIRRVGSTDPHINQPHSKRVMVRYKVATPKRALTALSAAYVDFAPELIKRA